MQSQNQLIIERLKQTPGEWVSMPELVQVSGSFNVHSRIDELRHKGGHAIENRTTRAPGSRRHQSSYRVPAPAPAVPALA